MKVLRLVAASFLLVASAGGLWGQNALSISYRLEHIQNSVGRLLSTVPPRRGGTIALENKFTRLSTAVVVLYFPQANWEQVAYIDFDLIIKNVKTEGASFAELLAQASADDIECKIVAARQWDGRKFRNLFLESLNSPLSTLSDEICYLYVALNPSTNLWVVFFPRQTADITMRELIAKLITFLTITTNVPVKDKVHLTGDKEFVVPLPFSQKEWGIIKDLPFSVGLSLLYYKMKDNQLYLSYLVDAIDGFPNNGITLPLGEFKLSLNPNSWASKTLGDALQECTKLVAEHIFKPPAPAVAMGGVGGNLSGQYASSLYAYGNYWNYWSVPTSSGLRLQVRVYPVDPIIVERLYEPAWGVNNGPPAIVSHAAFLQRIGDYKAVAEIISGTEAVWYVGEPPFGFVFFQTRDIYGRPVWTTTPYPNFVTNELGGLVFNLVGGDTWQLSYVPPHQNPKVLEELMWRKLYAQAVTRLNNGIFYPSDFVTHYLFGEILGGMSKRGKWIYLWHLWNAANRRSRR